MNRPTILSRDLYNSEKNQAAQKIVGWLLGEFELDKEDAFQVAKSSIEKLRWKPPTTYPTPVVIEQLTLLACQYIDKHPEEFES